MLHVGEPAGRNDHHRPTAKRLYQSTKLALGNDDISNDGIHDILKNDYSKHSVINDHLSRMSGFRLAIFPELGWDVVCIDDLSPMLKILLAFQTTTITKITH